MDKNKPTEAELLSEIECLKARIAQLEQNAAPVLHLETALQASEDRFRRAFEIETVGIIFFKPDGIISGCNDAFLRMSGYTREDADRGLVRWDQMTPPEYMAQSIRAVEEFLSLGHTTPYEKEYIRKDGSRWWALFAATRISPEEGVEFIIDITQHKQVTAALQQSYDQLKLATDASQVAWGFRDFTTGAANWDERGKEIFGFANEEESHQVQGWIKRIHPDDRSFVEAHIADCLHQDKDFNLDYRIIRADGQERWVHAGGRFRKAADGTPLTSTGLVIDITERRRTEEALLKSEEKYHRLFEMIDEGFSLGELVRDDQGQIVSYRILEANPAIERHTGLTPEQVTGKLRDEMKVTLDDKYLNLYASVVEKAEPVRLEMYNSAMDRWHNIGVFPRQGDQFAVLFSEITEQKRSEVALRESEKRLALVFESLPVGVGLVDTGGKLVFTNREMQRFVPGEMIPSVDDTSYDRWCSYYPDGRRIERQDYPGARALRGEEVVPGIEFLYRQDDGNEIWVRIAAKPVRDESGKITGALTIATDINALKRGAEALRESQATLHSFYNTAPFMMGIGEIEGDKLIAVSANLRTAEFFGTQVENIPGRTGEELGTSEDIENLWLAQLRKSQREKTPVRFEYQDWRGGSKPWLGVTVAITSQGTSGRPQYSFIAENITEQKQVEEALRESEARFRAIADLVPDLLWSNDSHGGSIWHNRRWLEYTGQIPDEAMGNGWREALHPDDWAGSRAVFIAAAKKGQPFQHEQRLRDITGQYRWFLVRAQPIRNEQGDIIRWYGAATDIHEQRTTQAELEERVRDRTTELNEVNQSLSEERERLRRLSARLLDIQETERRHLARELHDEIGQYLTGLKFMLANLQQQPIERQQDYLDKTIFTVNELTERVRDLSLNLRPTVLDDLGLVPALLAYLERYSAQTRIQVDFNHLGMIDRLAPEIEQVVYRVVQEGLTNIARYAGIDRVTVQLIADELLTVFIQDEGKGFELVLEQAGYSSTGLSAMRERVELVGGRFSIESEPGSGTTLIAEIPLVDFSCQ